MKPRTTAPSTVKQSTRLLAASFLIASFFVPFSVVSAPAAWYKWKSRLNGEVWCTQISPGDGWVLSSGPYKDAHCKIEGRPGKQ